MEVYDFFILYLDNNLYSCYTWDSSCPDGKTDLSNKVKVNTATARLQTYISVIKFSASLKQPLLYFTLISWKYAHKKLLSLGRRPFSRKAWKFCWQITVYWWHWCQRHSTPNWEWWSCIIPIISNMLVLKNAWNLFSIGIYDQEYKWI